jgi:hypothetical protein
MASMPDANLGAPAMKSVLRKLGIGVLAALLYASPALAVTDFLWDPGTGNNGEIASTLTLLSTELNSLAGSGAVIVSSVGGSSGVFTNSNTGQAIWGEVFFNAGTAGGTCPVGSNISLWFLTSTNGTTFEPTAAVPARSPDVIIPLPNTTLNATYKAQGLVQLPALNFKVLAQNNCGANALASSGNTITVAPMAVHYNYLLKRDIDPAANDNTPAFLNEAA